MNTCSTFAVCLALVSVVVSIGIPSPPEILEINCMKRTAVLSWTPTGNEPVSEYKIQYKTNWDKDKWIDYTFLLPLTESQVRLFLSPWANYTFRVNAVNNAGASNYSGFSDACTTEEDVPHKNPDDVYGRGIGPKNLLISWTPMPPIDQNAPGFFYTVYWRLNDDPNDPNGNNWHHRNILDWQEHRLLIENLPQRRAYRIKVEAANSQGKSTVEVKEVIGFSDEDRPTEEPKFLKLVEIIDGKSAKLEWKGVDPKSINGHFKGYKVNVWTDNYDNRTTQIVAANTTSALINIFTPNKTQNVLVLAFNGAYDGPASNTLVLEMPEDVYPDPPSFVWQRSRNQFSKAVIRIRIQPNKTNDNPGQLIYIRYRKKSIDTLDNWQNTVKEDIDRDELTSDLVNLDYENFYEVQVVAESGNLSSYSNISMIDTHENKWATPTTTTTPTPPTTPSTQAPIYPSFFPEADPSPRMDTDGPNGREDDEEIPEKKGFSKTPWFIALICVLAFIFIFVGVFIFLKKRKIGGAELSRRSNDRTNQNKTVTTEANNGNGPIRPNERDSFINMNQGRDEPDDEEPEQTRRDVYQGTTQTNH